MITKLWIALDEIYKIFKSFRTCSNLLNIL